MKFKRFISGCLGPRLCAQDKAFFRAERPYGLILFARNMETPEQIAQLCAEFREAVGRRDAPVFIDQEGGRVQRFGPPYLPKYPAAGEIGQLYGVDADAARRAAYLHAFVIGGDLRALGITANCIPCLDLPVEGASWIIGARAYGSDARQVTDLGRQAIQGCLDAGVFPVMKHMPGHGRALVDTHELLPVVECSLKDMEARDFLPFRALCDCPFGMTAHIVFSEIDKSRPVTQSRQAIDQILREALAFDGVLLSDDISMKALGGELGERVKLIVEAGCDMVLHCNGELDEMRVVANAVPEANADTLRRIEAAEKQLNPVSGLTLEEARAEFEELSARAREL